MKTRKNLFMLICFVFLFFLSLSSFGVSTALAREQNWVRPGKFFIEPSTLICLGFEWYIDADDNHNATVEVWYHKKGDKDWKEALPLLRLDGEQTITAPLDYVAPNMFAGSIFDLEPDTEYECKFLMSDPDGVIGYARKMVTVRTRPEPKPFAGGNVYHVYPPGYTGTKQSPAFTGLLGAYYTGYSQSDHANVYPPRVVPGDIILVHAGLYKDNRFMYGSGLGTVLDGSYYLTQSGTPEKPIVIKAAGDGEVIFDGDGCFNLFNVMAANYNYFEGLTIRNTDFAFYAGIKNITGSSGLTVKKCRIENVGIGVHTDYSGSKNFYIADNVFIGRQNPDSLMGWTGNTWRNLTGFPALVKSNYAVKVYGSGHVVAHNYVANFHDGIDVATYGLPDGYPEVIRDRMPVSIDFYNNDITNVDDNCLESDGGMHNIRVLRNRCLNGAHRSLSAQTLFGGPAYWIRNIVYHAPEGGSIKFYGHPTGLVLFHNTLCAEVRISMATSLDAVSNAHFRNNLVLGEGAFNEIFYMDTFTNYTTSDYNGYRPNEGVVYPFVWGSPPFDLLVDYAGTREQRKFRTLAEMSQATGEEAHSILIDWNIFENLAKPDTKNPTKLYKASDLNFKLRPNGVAVDAGCILPNVNDNFTGVAPDLGALEVGSPMTVYGPRP
jgi:hypothetical protein